MPHRWARFGYGRHPEQHVLMTRTRSQDADDDGDEEDAQAVGPPVRRRCLHATYYSRATGLPREGLLSA